MANAKTIEIKDDANLGIAMLIAEFDGGNYQPVAAVVEHQRSPRDRRQRHARADEGPGARRRASLPGALRRMGAGTRRQLPPSEGDHAVAPTTLPLRARPAQAGLRS